MRLSSQWNRRSFLGSLGMIAGAVAAPLKLAVGKPVPSITGFGSSGNPYDELGVKTVINCVGTMTVLGGSIIRPELETVMAQAGKHFVRIADLEVAAGKKISEMLKLPEGYTALVTSGAAAAILSGLAGILTGDNEEFIKQIPDLTGMKSEVIIQKSHRNPFDHQLRNTGINLVVIETREQLLARLDHNELNTSIAELMIERIAVRFLNDDFRLHSGEIGDLPDELLVVARENACEPGQDRGRCA